MYMGTLALGWLLVEDSVVSKIRLPVFFNFGASAQQALMAFPATSLNMPFDLLNSTCLLVLDFLRGVTMSALVRVRGTALVTTAIVAPS